MLFLLPISVMVTYSELGLAILSRPGNIIICKVFEFSHVSLSFCNASNFAKTISYHHKIESDMVVRPCYYCGYSP